MVKDISPTQLPTVHGSCRNITLMTILLSWFCLCANPSKICAEEMADSTHMLQEVMVKGIKEVTAHQNISRQQIMALPSSNVADALKYMAGVQIKDYGGLGGQKTINVRSLGSQHVGVYLDGVRITNAQNGTVDLGKYSLSTLESVSLFNANKAEMLMTATEYASASTVYLKTHCPDSTSFMASYQYGSFNSHKFSSTFSYGGKQDADEDSFLHNLKGILDASYTTTRGNYPFSYHTQYEDTTGTRQNSDIKMFRIEGTAFYKGLQWHTYYFDSERGLPGGVVRRLSNTYTDVGREWDRNFFTQMSYQNRFDRFGVRGIIKYTNDFLHYRSDYPENISAHSNVHYRQQDIYGALAGSYTLPFTWNDRQGSWGTSLSADVRWSDLNCNVRKFYYVYRMDRKASLSTFFNYGGWNANVSGLYTDLSDYTDGVTKNLHKITWNALLSYSYKDWTFRSFYKVVFRAPTLNDLYYTLVGNRNLKPEYTKQFDIGLSYQSPRFSITTGDGGVMGEGISVQLDGYYNHIEDRIVCLPLKGSYQWTMLNYGYTRCMGIDLSVTGAWHHHSLMLSGTFQDDRNRTDPTEDAYNDYIAYSPRWSFTAVYTFLYKGWSASLSHMFVDKRYWTAENAIEDPLEAYNCTDIKVGYSFLTHYTVEAECQDLFDERYEIIQRWPMPGRRFALTMKVTL